MPSSRTETSALVTALKDRHLAWRDASIGLVVVCSKMLHDLIQSEEKIKEIKLSKQERTLIGYTTGPAVEMMQQAQEGFHLVKKNNTKTINAKGVNASHRHFTVAKPQPTPPPTPMQSERGYVLPSEQERTFTDEEVEQMNDKLLAYYLVLTTLAKLKPVPSKDKHFWKTSLHEENVAKTLHRLHYDTQQLSEKRPAIRRLEYELACLVYFFSEFVQDTDQLAESSIKTMAIESMETAKLMRSPDAIDTDVDSLQQLI